MGEEGRKGRECWRGGTDKCVDMSCEIIHENPHGGGTRKGRGVGGSGRRGVAEEERGSGEGGGVREKGKGEGGEGGEERAERDKMR